MGKYKLQNGNHIKMNDIHIKQCSKVLDPSKLSKLPMLDERRKFARINTIMSMSSSLDVSVVAVSAMSGGV